MTGSGRVATLLLLLFCPALALSSCVCVGEPSACTDETKTCMPTSCDPRCHQLPGSLKCEKSCQECLGKSPPACRKVFGACRSRCSDEARSCYNSCHSEHNSLKCNARCGKDMFDCVTKCTNPV